MELLFLPSLTQESRLSFYIFNCLSFSESQILMVIVGSIMNFVVIHAVENKPFDLVSRGKICILFWNHEKGKWPLKV